MKQFVYGSISTLAIILTAGIAIVIGVTELGLVPINADAVPSSVERRLLPAVVRATVAREARSQEVTDAVSAEGVAAGEEIYKSICAQCHGGLNGRPSVLGASFYPPAPQLPGHSTAYSDAELFWIVKHGIRNTSMPAWRNLLSDRDIGEVVAFLRSLREG